jgi:ethanolamine transporter EutH
MSSFCAEKALLLPTVEPTLVISSKTPAEHRRQRIEYTLLIATLLLTAFQLFVLYHAVGNIPAFSDGQCYALLNRLARGLRISIPASLPTTALIFIFAPYIAEKERVVITRYAVLVTYLLGSTLGALLL